MLTKISDINVSLQTFQDPPLFFLAADFLLWILLPPPSSKIWQSQPRPLHPAEEMSERHDHSKNLIGTIRIQLFSRSFILPVYDVLARHGP